MGTHNVAKIKKDTRTTFIKHLLTDISALEKMLEKRMIEADTIRIGAEQEFCLVDQNWRPTNNANKILDAIKDSHFTNEIALYNLEINLDPEKLERNCFSTMENQLKDLLHKAAIKAKAHNTKILLAGILPTIGMKELSMEYMTPNIRYKLLNDAIKQIRKDDLELHIRGVEELSLKHDSILFEACNTSFQLHLQIAPDDFVASYNWAQAISGPVLGVSTNSPLLLGRELWSETRIALFQQSIDTRSSSYYLKDKLPRVTFGSDWAKDSIVDIYKDDIARFEIVLSKEVEKNSLEELKKGNIPKLEALQLHNGTIYRWNRPCYGHGKKNAHIRIENRYLPAGPTVLDQMANFAFWVGLMVGRPKEFDDMATSMNFLDAKDNFIKAARYGNDTIMRWNGKSTSVQNLVIKELLPLAYKGLEKFSVNMKDIEFYLGIIEKRAKGTTGSKWNIRNYRNLRETLKKDDALVTLTKAIYENQQSKLPVSQWDELKNTHKVKQEIYLAEHLMSTQLFTVNENDMATMASNIMRWKNIHHVPVLNDNHELCGLLTWNHIKEHLRENSEIENLKICEVMVKNVIACTIETDLETVYNLLKKNHIGCLPVLRNKTVVGIITTNDMIGVTYD